MIVKTIVENEDGTATIICDFTQAEVLACVELGLLKLLQDYLDANAPFHQEFIDAQTKE
jgi:hypothetical protein